MLTMVSGCTRDFYATIPPRATRWERLLPSRRTTIAPETRTSRKGAAWPWRALRRAGGEWQASGAGDGGDLEVAAPIAPAPHSPLIEIREPLFAKSRTTLLRTAQSRPR